MTRGQHRWTVILVGMTVVLSSQGLLWYLLN
ncbi:hypothetical protein Fbal_3219 [Ferrimonas balearica DSM 9799]|uniref:Uncharacterized protein n=1 Tax=Ferrimonas balearica (strain DSM 9799 / CCM 4581 / KCTC 23876 / PAT) TaxID=550540 RepID=E1SVW7_FERBD|nr:hypothetical protein Fbal_3219 [Ferrimonas balearica DSM 9799]